MAHQAKQHNRAICALVIAFSTTVLACATRPSQPPDFPEDVPLSCGAGDFLELWEASQPYVARARETYPEAKARWERGLPPGQRFFLTTLFYHSENYVEQIFVLVDTIEGSVVSGRIASDPVGPGFRAWDSYSFDEQDLGDWTIQHPDGTEEGNFVGKFLDEYQGRCAAIQGMLPNKPLQLTPHRSFQLIVLAFWHQSWSISPLHQRRWGAAERPVR